MIYSDKEGRERCHRCHKLVFHAQTQAKKVAANAQANGVYLRVYFSENCHSYHLTSQRSRYATMIPSQVPRQSLPEDFVSAADADRQKNQERRESYHRRMEQEAAEKRQRDQGWPDFFKFLFVVLVLPLSLSYKLFRKIGISEIPSGLFAAIVCLVLIDTVGHLLFNSTPVKNFLTGIFS